MDGFNYDYDFLKERYAFEHERRNKLVDSLGFPVAVLTAVGGLLAVMAREFSYPAAGITTLFVAALMANVCSFAVSLGFLAMAYWRQDTAYLQTLGELETARGILSQRDPATLEAEFADYVRRSIIEATDLNARSNDRRAGYLYRARTALLITVILTALLGLLYVVDQVKNPTPADETPGFRLTE